MKNLYRVFCGESALQETLVWWGDATSKTYALQRAKEAKKRYPYVIIRQTVINRDKNSTLYGFWKVETIEYKGKKVKGKTMAIS